MTALPNPTGCCEVPTPCCPNSLPDTLSASITSCSNCPGFVGQEFTLRYVAAESAWKGTASFCGNTYFMKVQCINNAPRFSIVLDNQDPMGCGLNATTFSDSATCSPVNAVFTDVNTNNGPNCSGCCTGSFGMATVVVTE